MKILITTQMVPHPGHGIRGGHVILFSLMIELARRPGLEVGLLVMRGPGDPPIAEDEQRGLELARQAGITVLEPLQLVAPPPPPPPTSFADFNLNFFYPLAVNRDAAHRAARVFNPDVVLPMASEGPTVLFADYPAIRAVLYGNPDPTIRRVHVERMRESGSSEEQYKIQMAITDRLEAIHLNVMGQYHILFNVAANYAECYSQKGHPNSFYVRNMWLDRFDGKWEELRRGRENPSKIIANVGKLNSTMNTLSLEYTGEQLLPELRRALAGRPFELHVLGPDRPPYQPNPKVDMLLQQPEFRRRGFVDDIDDEILTSPIFLSMVSASSLKAGHSRYLHAWSLGACVIAHRDSALAMPEIIHNENALLGESAAEIADLTALAMADPELRLRIGRNGYRCLMTSFTAEWMVDTMLGGLAGLGRTRSEPTAPRP